MKKAACLCLALVLLFAFSACGQAQPENTVLTVCIDEGSFTNAADWIQVFCQENPEIRVELEVIPCWYDQTDPENDPQGHQQKRAEATEAIRMELMAGGGPDVFILPAYLTAAPEVAQPLFEDLPKTMMGGTFANLGPLMEQAGFDETAMLQPVLQAGQYEGRQYILPLSYNSAGWLGTPEMAQQAGLNPGQPAQNPAEFFAAGTLSWVYDTSAVNPLYFWAGPLIDLEAEAMRLQAPAVLTFLQSNRIDQSAAPEGLDFSLARQDGPEDLQQFPCLFATTGYDALYTACRQARNEANPAPLYFPVPDESGGVAGLVNMYAAISAGCENQQAAFRLLALLAGEEAQCGRAGPSSAVHTYIGALGLPARAGCVGQWAQAAAEATENSVVRLAVPAQQTIASFEQAEARLSRVYLPYSSELVQEFDAALAEYEVRGTAALADFEARWAYYLSE